MFISQTTLDYSAVWKKLPHAITESNIKVLLGLDEMNQKKMKINTPTAIVQKSQSQCAVGLRGNGTTVVFELRGIDQTYSCGLASRHGHPIGTG